MSTYVLIHGAGSDSWYWHRVAPLLRDLGYEVITMDLTCTDESAGLAEYAGVVLDAIGDRGDLVVVGSYSVASSPRSCATSGLSTSWYCSTR